MNLDPLAEKYETISPYTYVLNNPVNAIDPDGRLVVFVNGLIFSKALAHKSNGFLGEGGFSGHFQYPPPRTIFRGKEPMMFSQRLDYWGGIDDTIGDIYNDHNFAYVNATDHFRSQADDRFNQGVKSGLELIEKLKNGTIELENGETIKIVGHSQGAAFAAGMLSSFVGSDYEDLIEAGIYIAPHQPGDFEHPSEFFGAQFSTVSDQVSSNGKGSGTKGTFLQLFNGGSKLAKIKSTDIMVIRPSHDKEHKGHGVQTWQDIFNLINNFLNKGDE